MLGSAVFRTGVAPGGALAGPWVRNPLWAAARAVPSLDLRFAENKSLVDATTGQNLVTFTRASSGTYVGSDGLIKTATTNLLLQSEDFSTTWVASRSSVSSNAITAPNGTLTAGKFIEDTTTSNTHLINQLIALPAGNQYTASVYVKAGERNWILFNSAGTPFGTNGYYVNLSDGSLGNAVGTLDSFSVTQVGDGWYRLRWTATTTTAGNGGLQIRLATSNGGQTYTGDGTSGIYIWGAQLEQSSTVGEYVKTTSTINSAPRFDHNPTTGESLGLLVEESRTNLLVRSEEFDNASWTSNAVAASVLANQITSPAGTTTADLLRADNGIVLSPTSGSSLIRQDISKSASAVTYTLSCYAKAFGHDGFRMLVRDSASSSNNAFAFYGLSGGGTVSNASVGGTFSALSTGIQLLSNGWYRCQLTFTTGTETSLRILLLDSNSTSITANGTDGIYLWGAQLEAGAFPTSYIPTGAATATRSADVASITGANFSSWYRQDEGTIYSDSRITGGSPRVWDVNDGGDNNRHNLRFLANQYQGLVVSGGIAQAAVYDQTGLNQVAAKNAYAYQANNIAIRTNGGAAVDANAVDISATVPVVDRLFVGQAWNGGFANGHLRRLTYWPAHLSNTTLQQITQ